MLQLGQLDYKHWKPRLRLSLLKRQNVNKKNIKQKSSYLPNPGAVEKKSIMEKERQERVEVEREEGIWGWERAGSGIEVLTEEDGL